MTISLKNPNQISLINLLKVEPADKNQVYQAFSE